DAAAVFDPLRPSLVRVAYRMLGSVADAEDAVQDAFLRWLDVDRNAVREPGAYLRRIVTRLCLDRLKSVRHGRESYIGTWLPEPVVESGEAGLDDVIRMLATFARVYAASRSHLVRYGFINGLPGFVTIERGDILQTTALEVEHGRVVAIYVVRNPDKLRHIADTLH